MFIAPLLVELLPTALVKNRPLLWTEMVVLPVKKAKKNGCPTKKVGGSRFALN
jgi:hypothetical protein